MTHGMSEDEAVKLDDIPAAFIQEALYDNFRPVQPLNTRTVYSSFEIEAPQSMTIRCQSKLLLSYDPMSQCAKRSMSLIALMTSLYRSLDLLVLFVTICFYMYIVRCTCISLLITCENNFPFKIIIQKS